jgi:sensor c-di-GMP phosphodiesterase-like protein
VTIDQVLQAIAGPTGALVLALIILYVVARVLLALWKEHLAADQRDREQRDRAQAVSADIRELLRQALQANADQIAAWNKRTEQEAARRRRSDNS